jgi:hypothetical protein
MAPSRSALVGLLVIAASYTFACGGSVESTEPPKADASGAKSHDAGVASSVDGTISEASPDVHETAPETSSTMMTIPLTGCDPFYTASVTIGGTQTFQLAVDTGSTTLAVAGSACPSCAEAGVAPLYQPGPAAVDTHLTASSTYDVGELGWSGEIYTDTVQVGGVDVPATMKLAVMQSEMGLFQTGEGCPLGEGIIGLGPTDLAEPGTSSFFDELVATGVPNVFAAELCDSNGYLWLGGYDPAHALSPPVFTPMIPNEFYAVQLSGVMVNGKSVGAPASAYGSGTTIIDTGGSQFFLPPRVFKAVSAALGADATFKSLVGGAGWFDSQDNCVPLTQTRAELDAMLPKLTVTFGASAGQSVSIQATATSSYLLPFPSMGQTYWCPGIGPWDTSFGGDFVGDIGGALLHSNIFIFDRQNQRVGFAPHGDCP